MKCRKNLISHILMTVILLTVSISVTAQPTVTIANEASIGLSITYVFLDTTNLQPGPSGANQMWDFSNAVPDGTTRMENWIDVAGTPFASQFTGANIVQETNAGAPFNVYLYHDKTGSQIELLGIAFDPGTGAPSVFEYSDSEIIRQYPATYNSTLMDTYEGVMSITTPIAANTYRTGTYEYIVDGYGTMISPIGNFPSVLRYKTRQALTDSTDYGGLPIPLVITQVMETAYFWRSSDVGDGLYQFYMSYDTTITLAGTTTGRSASYMGTTTSISETVSLKSESTVYPNPATDIATIVLSDTPGGDAVLEIYDMLGNLVSGYDAYVKRSETFEWKFQVQNLPAGLYMTRVTSGEKTWTKRLVRK